MKLNYVIVGKVVVCCNIWQKMWHSQSKKISGRKKLSKSVFGYIKNNKKNVPMTTKLEGSVGKGLCGLTTSGRTFSAASLTRVFL